MVGELRRGDKVVIASHNEGKVRELAELFAPIGIEAVSAASARTAEPEETGESFAENAKIKAGAAACVRHACCRRRFRARGHGAWRRSRHPLGALGRTRQGFRPRHGARQSRARGERLGRPARQFRLRARAWPAERRDAGVASAKSTGRSSGRRAARAVSATIRSSCRTAILRPSARWTPWRKARISHRMRAFEKLILSTWPYDED